MTKFAHVDILDGGLLALKNTATRVLLIKNYSAGDSFATVMGNLLSQAVMTPEDLVIASVGANRAVITATKSAIASAADAPGDHHVAFTNGLDKVLWVTDETAEDNVGIGDTTNFPSLTYTSAQPI